MCLRRAGSFWKMNPQTCERTVSSRKPIWEVDRTGRGNASLLPAICMALGNARRGAVGSDLRADRREWRTSPYKSASLEQPARRSGPTLINDDKSRAAPSMSLRARRDAARSAGAAAYGYRRLGWAWPTCAIFGIFCAKALTTGRKRGPHRRTQRSPRFNRRRSTPGGRVWVGSAFRTFGGCGGFPFPRPLVKRARRDLDEAFDFGSAGAAPYGYKFIGQFAEGFGDKLLPEGIDIDFQAKLLFQVQNELNKVETLLNHLARFQGLDVVARNVRKVLCEKFLHSL